jgi:hypothetical protein
MSYMISYYYICDITCVMHHFSFVEDQYNVFSFYRIGIKCVMISYYHMCNVILVISYSRYDVMYDIICVTS